MEQRRQERFRNVPQDTQEVILAVETPNIEQLRRLQTSGASFTYRDPQRDLNLLHIAIFNHQARTNEELEVFQFLLSIPEIDKEHKNVNGETPLHYVFIVPKRGPEYGIELIRAGCICNMILPRGNTLLHLSVSFNWVDMAKLLIEKGVDINHQNTIHQTALMRTTQYTNRTTIVSPNSHMFWMLLDHGADPQDVFDFDFATILEASNCNEARFCCLIDVVNKVTHTPADLTPLLKKFNAMAPPKFRKLLERFGFIVEEAVSASTRFDELWYVDPQSFADLVDRDLIPTLSEVRIRNLSKNLVALVESKISRTVVDKLNSSNLPLIDSIVGNMGQHRFPSEEVKEVIQRFTDHGIDVTAELLDVVYHYNGYCEAFKDLLKFDIRIDVTPRRAFPTVYYDPQILFEDISRGGPYHEYNSEIRKYFTLHLDDRPRVPTLVELARNATQKRIIQRDRPQTIQQYCMNASLNVGTITEPVKRIMKLDQALYRNEN